MARGIRSSSVDRCPRCGLKMGTRCVCADIPTVRTRTRIVLVRHARELYKPSGTARIAALAMPELELLDYRDEAGAVDPPWLARGPVFRTQPVLPPEQIG